MSQLYFTLIADITLYVFMHYYVRACLHDAAVRSRTALGVRSLRVRRVAQHARLHCASATASAIAATRRDVVGSARVGTGRVTALSRSLIESSVAC